MQRRNKRNTVYDINFKLKILNELQNSSINEIVKKYKISTTVSNGKQVITRWLNIYNAEGANGLAIERRGRSTKADSPTKGRPSRHKNSSREEIVAENTKLRAEVDYLKKLRALAQSIKMHQTNKRP